MLGRCVKHFSRILLTKQIRFIRMSEPQTKRANIEETNTVENGCSNGVEKCKDPLEIIKDIKDTIKVTENGTNGVANETENGTANGCKVAPDENDGSVLHVKLLSNDATVPTKGSRYAAGYDLYSAVDTVIKANNKGLVKTDLSIAIPLGSYARIAPRSGLSWKHHLDVGAGVVDYDYRGNVGVVLFNHATEDFEVTKGAKIAQLVLEKIFRPSIKVVEDLNATERGSGGFGSTGK